MPDGMYALCVHASCALTAPPCRGLTGVRTVLGNCVKRHWIEQWGGSSRHYEEYEEAGRIEAQRVADKYPGGAVMGILFAQTAGCSLLVLRAAVVHFA